MRPTLGRFVFFHHPMNGLRQALFELVQRDDVQTRSVGQETFEGGFNDKGGVRMAVTELHDGQAL